jgi:hypothetical protein
VDGQSKPERDQDAVWSRRMGVTPEFFEVMGVSLTKGRLLDARDGAGQEKVAVVTEDFVTKFFPSGDAIGHRLQLQLKDASDNPWWTIVGVVPSLAVAARGSRDDVSALVLVPMTQLKSRNVLMLASPASVPLGSLATPVRKMINTINPDVPLFEVETVAGVYQAQTWPFRVFGTLFMSFGLAALLLAAAGLYGVMSFSVKRRTQEIGVRMALGADRRTILTMVMRQGAFIVIGGIVLGASIGGWLGGQMKQLLWGVEPWDLPVFGSSILVLGSVGLLASFLPARKAASTDPLSALRTE